MSMLGIGFRHLGGRTVLALGLLAAACNTANAPEPRSAAENPEPEAPAEPSAFPAEPGATEAPDADVGSSGDDAPSASGAAAPPASAARADARDEGRSFEAEAPRAKAETKSSRRAIEPAPERPGLGTSWGENRTSHVSSAPFERASSTPFALTTLRYNDRTGIAAMLRGASFVDFQAEPAPAGGALTVRLLDENGAPLPTFVNGGRTLVQGEHGQRYVIEVQNRTANRFEAVVSVDGLDVVDGQPGSFSKRGYLVQPFATVEIDGFRRSMSEVAAFRFGSVRGSYAAKKGNDRNVGVIGVAFFAERGAPAPWTERELVRRESADPFPGRFASPPIAR